MKLILETPVILRFYDVSEENLIKLNAMLKYKDSAIEQQLMRTKKNSYYHQRLGQEEFQKLLDHLNSQLYKSILLKDDDGYYTLSGMKDRILKEFPDTAFENMVYYPDFKLIPWNAAPTLTAYEYQEKAVFSMLQNPHSSIELATGTGKSFITTLLVKHVGLPTIIATPSIGLAKAMYVECKKYFGPRKVGMFGDGKKEVGKDILICVGKSLSMVQEEDFKDFKKYQVLISDESHTLPSSTFNYFCTRVLGHCPYRWFLSATQERNDGKDIVLEGLINKRVFEMSIQDAIAKGFLAKLNTLVFDVPSYSNYMSTLNATKMNQSHFYGNPHVLDIISKVVTDALDQGIPTLILIDEHEQERLLRNRLGDVFAYARGGSDTYKICEDFNAGKILCVVGTSAISTGTNFLPVKLTINWQGGKAETKVKQGPIGRSTRIHRETNKTECKIIDFRINNVPMLKRHANMRIKLYKEIGPVNIIEYRV